MDRIYLQIKYLCEMEIDENEQISFRLPASVAPWKAASTLALQTQVPFIDSLLSILFEIFLTRMLFRIIKYQFALAFWKLLTMSLKSRSQTWILSIIHLQETVSTVKIPENATLQEFGDFSLQIALDMPFKITHIRSTTHSLQIKVIFFKFSLIFHLFLCYGVSKLST